jgi:hypothetical protein
MRERGSTFVQEPTLEGGIADGGDIAQGRNQIAGPCSATMIERMYGHLGELRHRATAAAFTGGVECAPSITMPNCGRTTMCCAKPKASVAATASSTSDAVV